MKGEIEFVSHPANLCLVRNFVREFLSRIEISEKDKDLMILGLDEACTNVIRYAYEHCTNKLMVLSCECDGYIVTFRLRDFGAKCSQEKLKGRDLEAIAPGGLGIHLIRTAFTTVDYIHCEEGTELVLGRAIA